MKIMLLATVSALIVPATSFAYPTGKWVCHPPSSRLNSWMFQISEEQFGPIKLPVVKVTKSDETGVVETLEGVGSVKTKAEGEVTVAVAQGNSALLFADITFEKSGQIKGNTDFLVCE